MIERNLAMIDNGKQQVLKSTSSDNDKSDATSGKKITKPADIVRMYDLLLQVSDYLLLFRSIDGLIFSF